MMTGTTSTLFQIQTLTIDQARYVASYYRAVSMIHDGPDGLIAAQIAEAAQAAVDMEAAWPSKVDPGAMGLTPEGEVAMRAWDAARARCERASRAADYMMARR